MLDPKVLEKIDRELAEKRSEQVKDDLLSAIDNGLAIMVPGKPKERLAGYMAQTYSEDLPKILDPDYAKRRREGVVEPLMAEIARDAWAAKLEQIERALAMGIDPALPELQPPPQPLLFWADVWSFPWPWEVHEKLARDMHHLMREEGKKILAAPEPVVVGAGAY